MPNSLIFLNAVSRTHTTPATSYDLYIEAMKFLKSYVIHCQMHCFRFLQFSVVAALSFALFHFLSRKIWNAKILFNPKQNNKNKRKHVRCCGAATLVFNKCLNDPFRSWKKKRERKKSAAKTTEMKRAAMLLEIGE